MSGVSVPASTPVFSSKRNPLNARPYPLNSSLSTSRLAHLPFPSSVSILNFNSAGRITSLPVIADNSRTKVRCNDSTSGGPNSSENESKVVLDAFFLGKAFAEAFTERVESAVGEVLSTVGRLQAEQQKQVQEFQDEVFARAKRAKEEAAREAMGEQGRLIVNPSSTTTTSSSTNNYSASTILDDSLDPTTAAATSSSSVIVAEAINIDEEEGSTTIGNGDADSGPPTDE